MSDEALTELAQRAGISVQWRDYADRPHTVSPEILRTILAALGLPAGTRGEMAASRRALSRKSSLADLPPLVTATAGRPTRLDVGASEARPAKVKLERGGDRDVALVPVRGRLRVPAIPETGYHRLLVGDREIVLAVAPPRCRAIEDVVPDARLWGVAAQIYALRRPGDGGIGDAAGLADLGQAAGRHGADAVALSPVHALFTAQPERYGPYSPSSRLFLNPLHAAPALVFGEERVREAMSVANVVEDFARHEGLALIDWPASATAKLALLRVLFDDFLDGPDYEGALGADFARFRAEGGALLTEHAQFEALHAERMADGDWRRWPVDLRNPEGPAVAAFAGAKRREILFHVFLQWLADYSLGIAHARALQAGMRIGVIGDLAVGMDPAGSHAWSRQNEVLLGLTIGAPPDLFNPAGQEWGLTGFSPRALEESGFAPFIATLRAVLRHAGGVRIDHALGLARLWLVPEGAVPSNGAYLAYPVSDLLRLLALESQRHGAVVLGEDLGTVPAGFRETLEQAGVHGTRVLWFEREANADFAAPRRWDPTAVAMTSTHDLPTVAGWWHGSDIGIRSLHGRLGNSVNADDVRAEREAERSLLWNAFTAEGITNEPQPGPEDTNPVVDAALNFVARTESPLCLVPLEDVLGQEEQPNLPGTVNEHPNWRRRQAVRAAELLDQDSVIGRVQMLAKERPRL